MKRASTVLAFAFLVGCKQPLWLLEARLRKSGSTALRNHREQVIFDYYHALKERRYEDAYKLRVWDLRASPNTLEDFIESHAPEHEALATEISIGDEEKAGSSNHHCDYVYTVYASKPSATGLTSGLVALQPNLNDPETCLIDYNSAFEPVP